MNERLSNPQELADQMQSLRSGNILDLLGKMATGLWRNGRVTQRALARLVVVIALIAGMNREHLVPLTVVRKRKVKMLPDRTSLFFFISVTIIGIVGLIALHPAVGYFEPQPQEIGDLTFENSKVQAAIH